MKRYSLCMLSPFMLLVLSGMSSQFPTQFDSKYYSFQSTLPKDDIEGIVKMMDLVYKTYRSMLNASNPKKGKVVIYKDIREMRRRERLAPNMSDMYAFYSKQGDRLVGHFGDRDEVNYQAFAHEGMHQFTAYAIPGFEKTPMWYVEGIADSIGNSRVVKNKLYMCLKDGAIAQGRLKYIQAMIKANKHIPWSQFLYWDLKTFYKDTGASYAQAWSMCHFFLTYPKSEFAGSQLPRGKYKKALAKVHNLFLAGESPQKVYKEAFKLTKKSMSELEAEWKDYVMRFNEIDNKSTKKKKKK